MSKDREIEAADESETPAASGKLTLLLIVMAMALPVGFAVAWGQVPVGGRPLEVTSYATIGPPSALPFIAEVVGTQPEDHPRVTHVTTVDLDGDGRQELLVCDAVRHGIFHYEMDGQAWVERRLVSDWTWGSPGHVTPGDLDGDGDLDLLVAILGSEWPTDAVVGRVLWLENDGQQSWTPHVLLDEVRRITDVQPGDLDQDGDVDLVVAEFGYLHGRVLWLENLGEEQFVDHELLVAPGPIHVPVDDFDGDGDLDVVACVTQEEEEVWGFENLGDGKFEPRLRRLFWTPNFDFGTAGMIKSDLDQDGDIDLLLSAGDNFEITYHFPQPYHGCYWLENQGNWNFRLQQIATLGGTYAADTADLDGDNDLDVVLVSMFNDWRRPGAASVVWLENDGQQGFKLQQIADSPISLATVACGDLDGDQRPEIIAGGFSLKEPYEPTDRLTVWRRGGSEQP